MKNIILVIFLLSLISCGKEIETDKSPINKDDVRSSLSHHLPELNIEKISNIRIISENNQSKKIFESSLNYNPEKDYLRRKLIYQTLKKIKNDEEIDIKINNKEYDLYNLDLFSVEQNITYRRLLLNPNYLLEKGSLSFDLNIAFENLEHIKEIDLIRFKVEAISKTTWEKIDLGYLKLKKFGDDNERLHSSGLRSVLSRHNYKFSMDNLDREILKKILIGDYQLGISLHDLNFKIDSGENLKYQKFIREFYSNRNFLYIVNGKRIERFYKLPEEKLLDTLRSYDNNLEISENHQIQFLNSVETLVDDYLTYNQIKDEPQNKGIWKISHPKKNKSNAVVYVESELIKKVESVNEENIYQNNNFHELSEEVIPSKKILIRTKGSFKQFQFKETQVHQMSTVSVPDVCEPSRRHEKGECFSKNLNCTFLKRELLDTHLTKFRKSDFSDVFDLGKKNKILKEWYSEELNTHFTIVEQSGPSLSLRKNQKIIEPLVNTQLGVFHFLNCPSQSEAGFTLRGQSYPARTMEISRKSNLEVSISTLAENY